MSSSMIVRPGKDEALTIRHLSQERLDALNDSLLVFGYGLLFVKSADVVY